MEESIEAIVDVGDKYGMGVCKPLKRDSNYVVSINSLPASVTLRWKTGSICFFKINFNDILKNYNVLPLLICFIWVLVNVNTCCWFPIIRCRVGRWSGLPAILGYYYNRSKQPFSNMCFMSLLLCNICVRLYFSTPKYLTSTYLFILTIWCKIKMI